MFAAERSVGLSRGRAVSQRQFSHGPLQRVAGPVVVVPAQKPAGEGGRFEALLELDDGGPAVSVGRVGLNVTDR